MPLGCLLHTQLNVEEKKTGFDEERLWSRVDSVLYVGQLKCQGNEGWVPISKHAIATPQAVPCSSCLETRQTRKVRYKLAKPGNHAIQLFLSLKALFVPTSSIMKFMKIFPLVFLAGFALATPENQERRQGVYRLLGCCLLEHKFD